MSRLILAVALLALGESAYAQQTRIYQHNDGSYWVNHPGADGGYQVVTPQRNGGWSVQEFGRPAPFGQLRGFGCLPGYPAC